MTNDSEVYLYLLLSDTRIVFILSFCTLPRETLEKPYIFDDCNAHLTQLKTKTEAKQGKKVASTSNEPS